MGLQWAVADPAESFGGPGPAASRKPPNTARAPASARQIASTRLGEQARRFPDLALTPLHTAGLDERDAALAHAVYDAAIRRWHTLVYLLDRVLTQPFGLIEPALRGVLLGGAAQLMLLDRIPVHAAIDESVDLAKRLVRTGAGGLVNAVLRKVATMKSGVEEAVGGEHAVLARDRLPLGDGRWVRLAGPILPQGTAERLAVATSHPDWLIRRWGATCASIKTQELALHSLISAPTVLNTAHARSPLPGGLVPHSRTGHHIFTGGRRELLNLLESRPDLWVQDAASSRAVASVAEHQPRVVIDACAGQGTKTRQLAATFPQARIVATDVDPQRLRTLDQGFKGSDQVTVIRPSELSQGFEGKADLVLLDVPCTNTGVLARRIEAKYRCGDEQLGRLVGVQRQIITDAVRLLAPGGRILYSTCSIDDEENTGQVAWAARELGLKMEHSQAQLPEGLPGQDPAGYTDGSFSAVLARMDRVHPGQGPA